MTSIPILLRRPRQSSTIAVSRAGLKKLRGALVDKRVLIQTGSGYTIRLPGLVLVQGVWGGHFIRESEAVKKEYEVACPAPKLTPVAGYNQWRDWLKEAAAPPARHDAIRSSYLHHGEHQADGRRVPGGASAASLRWRI